MLVATVSSSQVQCLTSLLIRQKDQKYKREIKRLLDASADPRRVVVIWAAGNFQNIGLARRIQEITLWNAFEVLDFLVQIRWTSARRSLDDIKRARDCAHPDAPKSTFTKVKVSTRLQSRYRQK